MAQQLYLMLAESPYWSRPTEDTAQAEKKRQRREVLYRDAAIVLRQMIRRDPSEAELRYRLAEALFLAGDTAEGKEAAMEARQLRETNQISPRNPTEALLHYRLADALFQAGEPDEARFQAHQGRAQPQREPADPQLHYRLAEALFRAGDPDEGRFHALMAKEMDLPALNPSERLKDPQHEQIKKWLEPALTQ
jgi:predicted Zn-dependent protease